MLGDSALLVVLQALGEQLGTGGDGEQRVAQVMAEHGNELFAHFGHGPLLAQCLLGALGAFFAFDLDGQQPGEGFHHRLDGTAFKRCG
ncbi:hypothetical protein D3C78_1632830 [compost metagenome]